MKNLIPIALLLIGFNINSQEIITDWNKLDRQTTLKEYIEDQVYDYLKFNPTEKDTLKSNEIDISQRSSEIKLKVLYHKSILAKPLVVINKYPTDNLKIWNLIKLGDLKKVTLIKPTDIASSLYGTRGQEGVIIIEINKRKWRKIKRKYGS